MLADFTLPSIVWIVGIIMAGGGIYVMLEGIRIRHADTFLAGFTSFGMVAAMLLVSGSFGLLGLTAGAFALLLVLQTIIRWLTPPANQQK